MNESMQIKRSRQEEQRAVLKFREDHLKVLNKHFKLDIDALDLTCWNKLITVSPGRLLPVLVQDHEYADWVAGYLVEDLGISQRILVTGQTWYFRVRKSEKIRKVKQKFHEEFRTVVERQKDFLISLGGLLSMTGDSHAVHSKKRILKS